MSPATPIEIDYRATTFVYRDDADHTQTVTADKVQFELFPLATNTALSLTGLSAGGATFDMSFNELTFQGVAGTLGQVLTTDASGVANWTDLPAPAGTPSLAEVLAVGADASFNIITSVGGLNLNTPPEIGFPSPADSIQLGQVQANGFLKITSATASQVIDETKGTKQFSGNYMCINLAGTNYYMPLFIPI